MFKLKYIIAILATIALAALIAWGAGSYYGERRSGQESLLPENTNVITYTDFHWSLNNPEEVIIDPAHAADARFRGGRLTIRCVPDTYFGLNMADQKITANYHFLLQISGVTEQERGFIVVTLSQGKGRNITRYTSQHIRLPEGRFASDIDLEALKFKQLGDEKEYRWGVDFNWADGVRLDVDGLENSDITFSDVRFAPGMIIDFNLGDLWERCEVENADLVRRGSMVRLGRGEGEGTVVTPAIGIGTMNGFHDLQILEPESRVAAEIRSGIPADGNYAWGEWSAVGKDGDISGVEPGTALQLRFKLARTRKDGPGSLGGFRIRYIDLSPPGFSGPLFGTAHLPTYLPGMSIGQLLRRSTHSVWIRLPLTHPQFDEKLDWLVASDISVVGAIDLKQFNRDGILEAMRRYGSRIAVWELQSRRRQQGARFYTDLYEGIREISPTAIIFPERVGPHYFQVLSLNGLYQFATASGTQEEVLDRGFAWFFVMALIGLAIIIGLGPAVGYGFRFGGKELAATGIGVAASVVLLIPALLLTGLAGLTLPRDFAQIEIAFSRFVVSALLQEFVRALLILLPVAWLVRRGIKEKQAWFWVVAVSSLLFGLGHLGYPGLSAAEVTGFVIVTTIAGAIFGAVFYATRSLTAVMVLHLLSNIFLSTMTDIGPRL